MRPLITPEAVTLTPVIGREPNVFTLFWKQQWKDDYENTSDCYFEALVSIAGNTLSEIHEICSKGIWEIRWHKEEIARYANTVRVALQAVNNS